MSTSPWIPFFSIYSTRILKTLISTCRPKPLINHPPPFAFSSYDSSCAVVAELEAMRKLWRRTPGWLETAAARVRRLSPMLSLRLPSSRCASTTDPSLLPPRNPAPASSFSENEPGRFWQGGMSASAHGLRGGWGRGFRAVEALKRQEKDEDLEDLVDEESSEVDEQEEGGVVGGEKVSFLGIGEREEKRRVRGGGSLNAPAGRSLELLAIPGVGPRNLRKLVDKGFEGVDQLKQLYVDKVVDKSSQKMVEYLKSSIGIIHKNHAESITSFIKEKVEEGFKDGPTKSSERLPLNNRLTFCVEGNISVGKTTFLQRIANETIELRDLVEIVPEPIAKWQDIGPDHFNILDAFYAEPQRYAYTFQNYVFVTRVMQERESSGGIKPLRLMERSVFTDRMVFVRAVYEAKWMNEMEISIYDSWFDPVVSCLPGLIPDGFIYLRASPDTCHKRMMMRKRAEELGVSLDYLRDLHEKHESWLFPSQHGNHGVLSVSQLPLQMDKSLHPEIKDRVFLLEGDHMHPTIRKVPALVLDCEPDIDFNRDVEAKQQYARQVAEFFEFVKKKKEAKSAETGSDGKWKNQNIVLPQQGGLWIPPGPHFAQSVQKPMEFKRAMSFLSG